MSNLQINTTQNVNLDYTIGSIGERFVAFFIDGFILYLYLFLVQLIGEAVGLVSEDMWTRFGVESLIFLPAACYSLIMHSLFNGRTVGKMIMKLRVVTVEGYPVSWSNYLVRWILRLVDIWLFAISIGSLVILFSDRRQRLGDMAAGTVVISTKNKTKISHTLLEDLEEQYVPVFTNVTQLSDKDMRLIKETFHLANNSRDHKTLKMLRDKVESILNTGSDLYDVPYLKAVIKDYSYFTQDL